MKTTQIAAYSGYRHNRYDSYNCSRGILMALGASETADCFADADDYPNEAFTDAWENGDGINTTEFRKKVLANLDDFEYSEIEDLKEGMMKEYVVTEYYGETIKIKFTFDKASGNVVVDYDGEESFICEF